MPDNEESEDSREAHPFVTAGAVGIGSVCGIGSALLCADQGGVGLAIVVGIVCGTVGGVVGAIISGAAVRLMRA